MSKKAVLYIGVVLIVALFFLANSATGAEIEDKLSRIIRQELGLDSEVYQVIETEYQGEKVVLIVIFGSEKAQRSKLGSDIKSGLRKYEGESPVAISVLTRNKDASFRPYALRIIQNGETSQANEIIGITDGFKEGKMPEKVPVEGKDFWGSKGIITLGSSFDSTTPFKVKYGTSSAHFNLGTPGAIQEEETGLGEKSEKSGETKETEDLENQATGIEDSEDSSVSDRGGESSEDLENQATGTEDYEDRNDSDRRGESSPPVSSRNSKSGQGLSLLALGGALLAITLSIL